MAIYKEHMIKKMAFPSCPISFAKLPQKSIIMAVAIVAIVLTASLSRFFMIAFL